MPISNQPPSGTIFKLALLDLKHEWILTLCMILAIAAVLAPLLILLGLKYGTIQTMRDRLVEDPVNREVRPSRTLQLSESWFAEMRERKDVHFIVPTILRGSSVIKVQAPNNKQVTIDIVPAEPNDPLILENEGRIPQEGECVLSYAAAEELQVKLGESLTVEVTRTREDKRETEKVSLKIVAILNPRADALSRVYTLSQFVNDVESYREGLAIPTRGWQGEQPRPFLSFDGIRIVVSEPLTELEQRGLLINTGLAERKALDETQFYSAMGFHLPEGYSAYELRTKGNPIQTSSLNSLRNKLRGKNAIFLPFADNLPLFTPDGKPLKTVGLSLSPDELQILGLPALPWSQFSTATGFDKQQQMLIPPAMANETLTHLEVVLLDNEKLRFPISVQGNSFTDSAIVPVELMGALRTGQFRKILFDEAKQDLLLSKSGYRGFRLYARSIDDVPHLYRYFIEQNMEVLTQVHEIEKVKVLDRGLTRIFWLVAIVGIIGGMASLVASLYAAVERKKRDISVLRLMGLSRIEVFRFPIYQAFTMAVLSVLIAIGGYLVLASIINFVFSADLKMGQKICTLPYTYFMMTLVMTGSIAILSSLFAAWKATSIDPAEAIREE